MPITVRPDEVLHVDKVFVNNPQPIPIAAPFTLEAGFHMLRFMFTTHPDGSTTASLVVDADSRDGHQALPPATP